MMYGKITKMENCSVTIMLIDGSRYVMKGNEIVLQSNDSKKGFDMKVIGSKLDDCHADCLVKKIKNHDYQYQTHVYTDKETNEVVYLLNIPYEWVESITYKAL